MTHNDDCQYCKSLAEELAEKHSVEPYQGCKIVAVGTFKAAIDEAVERCAQVADGPIDISRDQVICTATEAGVLTKTKIAASIRALKSTP